MKVVIWTISLKYMKVVCASFHQSFQYSQWVLTEQHRERDDRTERESDSEYCNCVYCTGNSPTGPHKLDRGRVGDATGDPEDEIGPKQDAVNEPADRGSRSSHFGAARHGH